MHRTLSLPRFSSAVGALAAALVMAPALRAQSDPADEPERPEVLQLDLRGVHSVDQDALRASIATEASSCKSLVLKPFCWISHSGTWWNRHYLDRTEFKRDVLRIKVFYFKRGYRSAQVDTAVAPVKNGVRVSFTIAEGPPTLVARVEVDRPGSILSDADIGGVMTIKAGQPLNLLALDSSMVLLKNELWDRGYSDAVVTPSVTVADMLHTAAIAVGVDPKWRATVDSIRVEGNDKISDRTILNSLTLKPGDIYRRSEIVTSQRNLYESNLFRRAVIVLPPQGDSAKRIQVTVQEAPLHEVRASFGFNTVDFVQTEGRYTNYNWFGGARRLDLRATLGNLLAPQFNNTLIFRDVLQTAGLTESTGQQFLRPTWQVSADVTQRWFHSPRNSIGANIFTHRRSAAGIFVDKGYGASASFTRMIGNRSPLTASYRFEVTEVVADDIYFCVNYGVCEARVISALSQRQRLSPLGVSYSTDQSNDLFNPSHGYVARVDVEHASQYTASDFHYDRVAGEISKYWQVKKGLVLAARTRAGAVWTLGGGASGSTLGQSSTEILHPRKRFYAGGSQSVRGYGENQLGPRLLTISADTLLKYGCDPANPQACTAAQLNSIPNDDFQRHPLGGSSLLEGNLELRFPIWNAIGGAVFVDGAFVGQGALKDVAQGAGAITPGFGARYNSPAGAIRLDLGIRPTLAENLTVVTERFNPARGTRELVTLGSTKLYDPVAGASGFRKILDRLQLHLSIGQAF